MVNINTIKILKENNAKINAMLSKDSIYKILNEITTAAELKYIVLYSDDYNTHSYSEIIIYDATENKIKIKDNWTNEDTKSFLNRFNSNIWGYYNEYKEEFKTYYVTKSRLNQIDRWTNSLIENIQKKQLYRIAILEKWAEVAK